MKKELMNYEAILKVTGAIVMSRDPEEVALLTVESVKSALHAKGCALLLLNRKTDELEVAASFGLSEEYLNKGPLSSLRSIAGSLKDGPVAISDVADDPRIQYPEEARKEMAVRSLGEMGVPKEEAEKFVEDVFAGKSLGGETPSEIKRLA